MPTATQKLLLAHPWCCFCGGAPEPAVTTDHQPARIMFPNKHRPKGLEFPACAACNKATSSDEALVGVIARATGGHRFPQASPDTGLPKAMKAVEISFPGLLKTISKEEFVNINGIIRKTVTINGNHPQVETSACRVAAKLALAAYYDHHGAAAPTTVKINTMWTHNQNPHTRPGVFGLLDKMSNERSLKQGRWDTQDTFFIRFDGDAVAFLTVARPA